MALIRFCVDVSDAPLVDITRMAIPGGTAATPTSVESAPIMLIRAPVSSMIERASSPRAASVCDNRSRASELALWTRSVAAQV